MSPAARKAYNAGWKASEGGSWGAVERADIRGVDREWYDGFNDHDGGHAKFKSVGGATAEAAPPVRPSVDGAFNSPHWKSGRTAEEAGVTINNSDALDLVRNNDSTGRRILDKGVEIPAGKAIGVRANLNVKKTTGITVQTLHDGTDQQLTNKTGFFGGEAIGYAASVVLTDVNFSVNQVARQKIASGQSNKFPMASVDGKFHRLARDGDYDGVELRFNPMRGHLFTDPSGRPVQGATRVTVVGNRTFVRGTITYFTPENMPQALGDIPTDVQV